MISPIEIIAAQSSWSPAAPALVVDIVAKASLLLLLAIALDQTLGRVRARFRSVVLNAAVAGLIVLPVAAVVLPRLQLRCLPPAKAVQTTPSDLRVAGSGTDEPEVTTSLQPMQTGGGAPCLLPITTYGCIVVVFLLRLCGSLLAIVRLRRSAVPVLDSDWLNALRRWRGRLGIRRPVALAVSDRVSVPTAVGWLRPAVLLPETLLVSSEADHRDLILLHELAHIRRFDYAWQLLLRIAQAVYWPHPLVWLAGRLVAGAREQACDDVCVYHTRNPEAYRGALIRVATLLTHGAPVALGTAFARSTRIGRRLDRIAAGCHHPQALSSWPLRVSASVLGLAGVMALGPLELACRESKAEPVALTAGSPETTDAQRSGDTTAAPTMAAPKPLSMSGPRPISPTTATQPSVAGIAATKGPSGIQVDDLVYDFGTVLGQGPVRHTFKLRNTSSAELKIESVRPTCGCTTAGEWAKTVPPGGTWELPVVLQPPAHDGQLRKQIMVTTSDPQRPEITFVLTGKVRARFAMKPSRSVLFNDLKRDEVARRTLTVINQTDTPLVLTDAAVSSSSLRVAVREFAKGTAFELEVTTVPPIAEGTTSGEITIQTNSKDEPILKVPVVAVVPARLTLTPSTLSVSQNTDQDSRRALLVRNTGSSPVHVKAVHVSDPAIRTELQTLADGKTYQIWATLPKGLAIPPEGCTLVVQTDDPQLPTLTAQIRPIQTVRRIAGTPADGR